MPYANKNPNNFKNCNWKSWREGLMPPEPPPWDRKGEFFRERNHGNGYGYGYRFDNGHHYHHDNIGGGVGPGGGGRWRDSSFPFAGSRNFSDFSPRWSDFRRSPGYGKQGTWHGMYHEDSGHGYLTPRSDRFVDDDGFRPSGPRGDGRYGRIYRENRIGYGQRDWRSHSWENNHHYSGPSSTPGRPHNLNDQRSNVDSPLRPSHPNSDSSGHLQLKDQAYKTNDANGTGTSQKVDKEITVGSLDWKPLKWSRSGSLTSRGSGLSHSSSSKSTRGESSDRKGDLPPKCLTPVQSPSGDAAGCAPSDGHTEDTASKKKPRLGWGEGLAKYEKKKVDGPEENTNKVENPVSVCNVEPLNSLTSNLSGKSPKITGFSNCSSPATPSSFACSFSPGIEEKTNLKTTDGDANNFSVSSIPLLGNHPEGLQLSLENLELDSVTNLSSLLVELLQMDDQCSMDSGFTRSSAFNKLLLWKNDISKALELTEFEIDSLENELKVLTVDCGQGNPCLALSSPSTADGKDDHSDGWDGFTRPGSLEVVSSGNVIVEDTLGRDDAKEIPDESKDADIDSPGTATSKLSEHPVRKPLSPCVCGDPSPADTVLVDSMKNTPMALHSSVGNDKTVGTSCQYDDAMVIQDDNGAALIELRGAFNKEAESICDVLLASNKDIAAKASEVFIKLLPSCGLSSNSTEATRLSCLPADSNIREKFLRRKQFLRFKERVLSLNYRAYHYVWKEDLRLLSLRKHRSRLKKKLDLSSQTMLIGNQKHRSSIRSRFASLGGSLSLVPRTKILNFTSKLLADNEVKPYRSSLKMPAMILDEKERMSPRFVSINGLVEDPCAVEKERALINPWTVEEKEIFMEKFASHGKDFSKIASFLDHKTTADCIEFYYKNHRSECFEKPKKLDGKKQLKPLSSSTYLRTSGKKWGSREMNAASLDLLGAASVIASQADQAMKTSKSLSGKISSRKSREADGIAVASSSFYAAEDERETAAADVLAGICGSFSSEALSSCVTSSVDPGEGNLDWKRRKVGSVCRPLTPDVTQNVDDDTCSDESYAEMDSVDWTDDEKSLFVQAFSSHGKDFLMISRFVRTKTRDQCKVFFSKARKCLSLDSIHSGTGSGILGSNDTYAGGSDNGDACVVETGSVVCSDKSGSRMHEEKPHVNQDVSKPDPAVFVDLNAADENCGPGQLNIKDADMEPEVLSPSDNLADVSEIDIGGRSVDAQEKKLVEADNLQRRGVVITPDETLKEDNGKGVLARVSSCIDPQSVSCAIDVSSSGTFKDNELHVCEALINSSIAQDRQSQLSSGGELLNQLSGTPIVQGKSSRDCNYLPLNLSTKAEKPDASRRVSKVQSFPECYFRKCSRSASQNSLAQLPLRCKEDQNSDVSGFRNSAEADKPCSNVKLFGKILSKTSSLEKPTPSLQAREDKVKYHSSAGKFNSKPCSDQGANGNSVLAKHDNNSFLGLENVPITSGFWDGTKIQTGFPSVYPAAFSVSSPNPEQQWLKSALYSNECNINGACVFSAREYNSSSGSVIDCPVFRNPEGVQPFIIDVKQGLELCPEVQRNGFEPVSSAQGHGKGVVTLNVAQGEEGGGLCSDISDPVAALKTHYSQQCGGSGPSVNGIIRKENWKGQGDVGS